MTFDLSAGLDPATEWVLDGRPENPEVRDAVNVWIESDDCDFAMRVGIEALAAEWDAHDIWLDVAFRGGRVLNYRVPGTPHPVHDAAGRASIRGAGPVRFQCLEPFARWRVAYDGSASELTAEGLARDALPADPASAQLAFDIEMDMAVPPWVTGTLLSESGEMMAGKQGEYMSPRYEQLFTARGWLEVNGERREFTGKGLRIRRQGVRRLEGFWGHCWQSAVFPSGRAFGFCIYPPREDGLPNFNEGFIFDGEKRIPARAVDVPWLDNLDIDGDDVSFALETIDGQRVEVQGETFIATRSVHKGQTVLPPDFPVVQQAHVRYRWGDEEASGMVERSSRPSLIRFPAD